MQPHSAHADQNSSQSSHQSDVGGSAQLMKLQA